MFQYDPFDFYAEVFFKTQPNKKQCLTSLWLFHKIFYSHQPICEHRKAYSWEMFRKCKRWTFDYHFESLELVEKRKLINIIIVFQKKLYLLNIYMQTIQHNPIKKLEF